MKDKKVKNNDKKEVKDAIIEEVAVKKDVKKTEVKEENKKSNKSLIIAVLISLLVVSVITWFVPSGTFDGATYTAGETVSTGINEFFLSTYYSVNYYLVYLLFLVFVGIFYGVISKTKGYAKMIDKFAKFWENKKTIFILVNSGFVALLASVLQQPIVTVLFIPMIYSIAKKLKLSKVSTMLMTFGAMCIGIMGTTYGGYGLTYLNSSLELTINDNLGVRFAILVLCYFILNVFIVILNKKDNLEEVEEIYTLSESNDGKAWPYMLVFGLIFVISILGYVNFTGAFNIDVFTKFHTWLTTEVMIGETPIFGKLLGAVTAFGTWDPFVISYILMIIILFVKLFAHIKLSELFDNAVDGMKMMVKPVCYVVLVYAMFVLCYWSGITTTILYGINTLTVNFSPYINALGSFVSSLLHVDFEYSGFVLGAFYAAKFVDSASLITIITAAMNGFASLFVPTSVFMVIGLSLSNLSYSEWLKNIWKFLIALLIVLLLIFTIITFF